MGQAPQSPQPASVEFLGLGMTLGPQRLWMLCSRLVRLNAFPSTLPDYIRHEFRLKVFARLTLHLSVVFLFTLLISAWQPSFPKAGPEEEASWSSWQAGMRVTQPAGTAVFHTTAPAPTLQPTLVHHFMKMLSWAGLAFLVASCTLEAVDCLPFLHPNKLQDRKKFYPCCRYFLLVYTLLLADVHAEKTGYHALLQPVTILFFTSAIATGMCWLLSQKLTWCSHPRHQFVLCGIKVVGGSPVDCPAYLLMIAWGATVELGIHTQMLSDRRVIPMTFCMICLFLIDADYLLCDCHPESILRIIMTMYCQLATLLSLFGLKALCAIAAPWLFSYYLPYLANDLMRSVVIDCFPITPSSNKFISGERSGGGFVLADRALLDLSSQILPPQLRHSLSGAAQGARGRDVPPERGVPQEREDPQDREGVQGPIMWPRRIRQAAQERWQVGRAAEQGDAWPAPRPMAALRPRAVPRVVAEMNEQDAHADLV